MPIYEYKCSKCGNVFEFLVRDGEKPSCPECASKRLKKLISPFSAKKSSKSGGGRSLKTRQIAPCASGSCCCGGSGCSCRHCG